MNSGVFAYKWSFFPPIKIIERVGVGRRDGKIYFVYRDIAK